MSGTRKYDRGLTQLLRAELHWLDVVDRVTYKLDWMVYKCLHGQAPDYLSELCMPVAQVAERQHLRSASCNLLVAPRFQLNTVVVPLPWLRQQPGTHCPMNCETRIRSPQCHLPTQLKDVSVSTMPGALSTLEALCDYALYKSTFTLHSCDIRQLGWKLL